jgi:4,5-DOPA dioxygenase extradiol
MYPKADMPVVQISLDRTRFAHEHYKLGAELSVLRNEGVLIIGSGNIVHNLRLLRWNASEAYPWAVEFDQLVAELILEGEHNRLIDYQALGEAANLAIPTNEHYLPLLYLLALRRPDDPVSFFAEGLPLGSISMRSVRIG